MAGLGTIATTAIITNGLDCGPACAGVLTGPFSLYCDVVVIPPPNLGGGGGGYPRAAWNKFDSVQDFYQPTVNQYYQVPRDKEANFFRKYINVTLKINIGELKVEKTYRVPEKRAHITINIFNLLNATQEKYKTTITNLKNVINKAKIKFYDLQVVKHRK
jgi:hypothetical protein